MKHLACAVAAVVLSTLGVTACSDSPATPDVQFLASDLYLMVGGHRITVPAVALRGPGHTFDLNRQRPEKSLKETLKLEASDPDHPMTMDKLDLVIRQYQYAGESLASLEICQHLKRIWSQALCRGQQRGLLKRLPEQFDLLDRGKLDLLRNHWTVGRERKFDQVKGKAIELGVTEIGCDRQSIYCTAVVEVLPGLLAVWTVWGDEKTNGTAEQMALTQGASIVQFVRRALGPAEDPTLVEAD
ncbi:MAG: hypothetical protein K2Y27_10800 [Xanthobacteraceae bacterium]|nr:hypothetical protein [Xanthobacteraceae bacterium]